MNWKEGWPSWRDPSALGYLNEMSHGALKDSVTRLLGALVEMDDLMDTLPDTDKFAPFFDAWEEVLRQEDMLLYVFVRKMVHEIQELKEKSKGTG